MLAGVEVQVGAHEVMTSLLGSWAVPVAHKLELRQRSGIQVKVSSAPVIARLHSLQVLALCRHEP